VELKPGDSRKVTLMTGPRLLARVPGNGFNAASLDRTPENLPSVVFPKSLFRFCSRKNVGMRVA
jgi:hypothetical protein